jgi:Ca2+-transporting ATPase
LEALESLSSPQVVVRREGRQYKLDSSELVPGDIVILESGGKVSADMRLLRSEGLSSNEMALTGESEPVHKNASFVAEPSKESLKSEEERKAELQARVDQNKDKMKSADKRGGNEGDASDDDDDDIEDIDTNGNGTAVDANAVTPANDTTVAIVGVGGEGNDNKEEKGNGKDDKEEEALTDTNCVYLGCSIVEGTGEGVVIKTGMATKMGEIALLLKEADEEISPLHKKLHGLGVRLGLLSIFCSVLVFIIGVTTGRGSNPSDDKAVWLQMLLIAVSLTVAAVPEGLPSCVTITLAVGMRNMVKRNALIRNLHSVETLGSATVICTDKTGTLTAGAMTAVQLWFSWSAHKITGEGYNPNGNIVPIATEEGNQSLMSEHHERTKLGPQMLPLLVGLLCSNEVKVELKEGKTWEATGNMSERPLVIAAKKVGLEQDAINVQYARAKVNQFNSARKMMSTLVSTVTPLPVLTSPWTACVKGAPNMVLEKCISIAETGPNNSTALSIRALTADDRERIMAQVDTYSEQAYRVLAVAYCQYAGRPGLDGPEELESNLIFAGLFAIWDPPRREVEDSIRKAACAGIRTVMITGDYVKTAKAIAEKIKLLPKGAPANKAVDCQIVRTLGAQLDDIKKELKSTKNRAARQTILARRTDVQKELDGITREADVFARAKPADKITIVRSLQRQGEICSMTGDGVNDAPALKQANIGVAMGLTGTDVAKAASDMVLTDDNFRSIVEAIECG